MTISRVQNDDRDQSVAPNETGRGPYYNGQNSGSDCCIHLLFAWVHVVGGF